MIQLKKLTSVNGFNLLSPLMEDKKEKLQEPEIPEGSDDGGSAGKVFTQDDVNSIISQRLAKEASKFEQEKKIAVEKAKEEAERLATLSQEEKQKELTAKQEAELSKKERELRLRENKLDAQAKLDELKMPIKFAEFVVDEDANTTNERIEVLSTFWNKSLEEAVAKQLSGNPPKDFSKSNSTEKQKLIASF